MDPTLESFPPIWTVAARVLVLGSMPGAASLAAAEYYAHPRNAFWPLVEELLGIPRADPYAERTRALAAAGVALWDVAHRCRRIGSLDAAMRDVEANDIAGLVRRSPALRVILCNGQKAADLLRRHVDPLGLDGVEVVRLPSTSPANAGTPWPAKRAAWRTALGAAGIRIATGTG